MADIVPKHHIGIDRVGVRKVGKGAALAGGSAAFVGMLIEAGIIPHDRPHTIAWLMVAIPTFTNFMFKLLSKYNIHLENEHDSGTH